MQLKISMRVLKDDEFLKKRVSITRLLACIVNSLTITCLGNNGKIYR